jgi:hydroxymethylpyrimidine pyrophosphatase-like HAD family hydrolase
MEGLDAPAHVYHLMSRGISKGLAIAEDLQRRGISAADAVAVGDSLGDLDMASHVGRFFLVSNGAAVPSIREAAEALPNVALCSGSLGAGWAEAARYCTKAD